MRIAQVSPLYESVPPELYGGTERVVSYLTEELVSQGHRVTLFASGDSVTKAELISPCPGSLRLNESCIDPLVYHVLMMEQVRNNIDIFDIVHFHIDYVQFPMMRRETVPSLTTLHGRLDLPDLVPLYKEFLEMPVVSISNAQRAPLPWLNWQGTVYHGLPENLYKFHEKPGKYLVFLGRISPEKRLDRAIEIAKRTGMELKIAAKIDKHDKEYYLDKIKPLLNHPLIEYIGEVGEKEKEKLLGNAYALVFPIDWLEPFGLVMIESMACGTPVIAWSVGSIPEIIKNGVSGFIVDSIDAAGRAVENITMINRKQCRRFFEQRYTATRMAREYVDIYKTLVEKKAYPILASQEVAVNE